MKDIKLNIIGYKSKESDDLRYILGELNKAIHKLSWDCEIKNGLLKINHSVKQELIKRYRAKKVLVKFIAEWSGYTSKQKKDCAIEYRKIDRDIWEKMDKTFVHNFSDNTYNLWRAEIAVKNMGDSYNSYGPQVDEFLKEK